MSTELDFRNANTLWGSVLAETLACCGVRCAVISPGSRSTPLTLALTRHEELECIPILDERSAAFFALGQARRTRRPVVLVCTSGSAGANYLPALIEAKESGVPLLVFTADRPPEMRDCGSGQTIDQQKLFGSYTVFYHEMAVPESSESMLAYLRQTIAQAVARAQGAPAGPVHLNMPFRDPLSPIADGRTAKLEDDWPDDFFDHLEPPEKLLSGLSIRQRPTTTRGLLIAGAADVAEPAVYAARIDALAVGLGWPILADVLSPLRHHQGEAVTVAMYDAILRDTRAARALVPRHVICLGAWPTSKVLRGWLEQSGAEIVMVDEKGNNRDALHGRTRHLPVAAEALVADGSPVADPSYRDAWKTAEATASALLGDQLWTSEELTEPVVAAAMSWHLPEEATLVVANSMPVRDLEYFWPTDQKRRRIYFSRGANGIDGTLSTALGIAHGAESTVLLTGDLAFLHDSNGLMIGHQISGGLTVVLINNAGGGIFEHLPIADFNPPFEQYFATPQKVDFAKLAEAHGATYRLIDSDTELSEELHMPALSGIRILEIRTDRRRDPAARKALLAAAAKAVGKAVG